MLFRGILKCIAASDKIIQKVKNENNGTLSSRWNRSNNWLSKEKKQRKISEDVKRIFVFVFGFIDRSIKRIKLILKLIRNHNGLHIVFFTVFSLFRFRFVWCSRSSMRFACVAFVYEEKKNVFYSDLMVETCGRWWCALKFDPSNLFSLCLCCSSHMC